MRPGFTVTTPKLSSSHHIPFLLTMTEKVYPLHNESKVMLIVSFDYVDVVAP
jgi:hypothetical protein